MILFDKHNNEVEVEVDCSGGVEDAFIDSAVFVNFDAVVPDDTIDYLQDMYAEKISEYWLEHQIMRAEYACEVDR